MRDSSRAVDAGKLLYARNCLACHGKAGKGTGNVPSLVDGKLNGVTQGEVFWFVTKGDKDNGMPAWAFLPEEKRWQIVIATWRRWRRERRRQARGAAQRHRRAAPGKVEGSGAERAIYRFPL